MKDDTAHFATVGGDDDEEFASSPPSTAASAETPPRRPRGRGAKVLSALALTIGVAAAVLYYGGGGGSNAARTSDDDDVISPTTATNDDPSNPSHFVEESPVDTTAFHNPLPSSPADVSAWSALPVESAEEHTLGYPFVAACVGIDEDTRPLANRMAGEFDILDAFPDEEKGDGYGGLFSPKEDKTWTYTFLLHDAEDLSYFLSFGLEYVPDLVTTRDLQDSRIGISHEEDMEDEVGPGRRRRLARPQCGDGTCRKTCAECGAGSQECDTFCGGDGGGGYTGTGECAIVTPIDYNAKFTPGLLGTYGSINQYSCYRTVQGTNNTVDDILVAYPNLTEKVVLDGYPTAENGDFLYALVLTNRNFDAAAVNPAYGAKGKVLSVSSIHSREFAPAETMTRFAEYLLQNYDSDPDIRWILDWNEIHLVLHGNPDGRKYDEVAKDFWRKNRNVVGGCSSSQNYGVDLNRNFPFKHNGCEESGCSSGTCSSETYRGPSEGSEQETKAIVEYAKTLFPPGQRRGSGTLAEAETAGDANTPYAETNTGVFMDVHSYGGYVGYPWGYKNLRSGNDDGLGALGRKMASYNEYELWAPEMPANLYPVDGDTLDTMYGWLGAAGLFWELGTSFYQSCTSFPDIINEAFPGLLYAAKVAKSPFVTSKGPDVLCATLGAPGALAGEPIVATVDVSDSVRANHADDGGALFSTGGQNVASVELYVNCHPNEGCAADVVETIATADTTATGVALTFAAPATEGDHVLYVRAVDSDGYAGAVTARSFVTCTAVEGCPFSVPPTPAPVSTPSPMAGPTPPPAPTCSSSSCTSCFSAGSCKAQSGCKWQGRCNPV